MEGRLEATLSALCLALLLLVLVPNPAQAALANAQPYEYYIAHSTGTVQSPSASFLSGNAGSSSVSQGILATVTATAGLTFYETQNAPTAAPALDGSASQGFTPAVVQHTSNACASGTSCSQAFASNVIGGDYLVVSIEWIGSVTSPTISDGVSGARCATWTQVPGSPISNTAETAMWYCQTTSGPATPTVSWITSGVSKLDIYEIAGYTNAGLTCNTGTGSGKSLSVGSTAFSGSPFLVAAYGITTGTITAGSGFTLSDTSASGDGGSGEFATSGVTSPTTFPASGSSGGASWAGIGCEFPKASSAVTSVTLTTMGTSDVIYVTVEILGSTTVKTVVDSKGLTYHLRGAVSYASNVRIETWYTTTTTAESLDTVGVTLSGMTDFEVIAFGISGTDTASPFDPNLASPSTNTGTSPSPSATITTSFPNDFIIGAAVVQGVASVAVGSGFTAIAAGAPSSLTVAGGAEYKLVTAIQSASSVSFTLATSENWAVIADAVVAGRSSATADTSVTAPGTSGSFTLNAGSSAFLWSPVYPNGGTLYAGNWFLDLWASMSSSSGTLTVSIFVVSSANAITATVLSSGTTGSIPTTETEVKTTFAGSGATIPVNGQILIVLTNTLGANAATIYWGTGQLTNFRSPNTYNYVLQINNPTSSPWTINLVTMASLTSNLGRLTNLTIWFVSPFSKQIIVSSGSLTQSSGPTITLAASSTVSIALAAYSNSIPTSASTPSTIGFVLKLLSTSSPVYAYYAVNLSVN